MADVQIHDLDPATAVDLADELMVSVGSGHLAKRATLAQLPFLKPGDVVPGDGGTATSSPLVSVKDLGLKGDGSTDDSAALQAAVSSHRALFFPAGRYIMASKVTVPANTALVGESLESVEMVAGDDYWLELLRNTDGAYTLDWSRCLVRGFLVTMAKGGILAHGHEQRLLDLKFRGGLAGRWCLELHAANEALVQGVSGGYGGGAYNLAANGLRFFATDDPAERTVNYGDSTLAEISFKGTVPTWTGVLLEHLSSNTSLGSINNLFVSRVQCQAPGSSGDANSVQTNPADPSSIWVKNGSRGLVLSRVQRSSFHVVDCEGNDIGCDAVGVALNLGSAATRRNAFIGCQAFNCRTPWRDSNGVLDGSVGQNSFIGGQEWGPVGPVGLASGDPSGTYNGRRATYDALLPGALWLARPGNGSFRGGLRMTDGEVIYFFADYQEPSRDGGTTLNPYDGMPKYQTPRKALAIDVTSSLNEARLFRPQGYVAQGSLDGTAAGGLDPVAAPTKDARIKIGNGEGFAVGGVPINPLSRVEIADPLLVTQWATQPPAGYGGNVPGIVINAGGNAALGNPSAGWFTGPGLYSLANDGTGGFSGAWFPLAQRPGFGTAQTGKSGTAYTVDRAWFGKLNGMANANDSTITIPAGLIRSDEDIAATHKTMARFRVRRGAVGRVVFQPGSGVTLYADTATSGVASCEIPVTGGSVEVLYLRTGTSSAEVYVLGTAAPGGGAATPPAWGAIGGNLGDQADLVARLAAQRRPWTLAAATLSGSSNALRDWIAGASTPPETIEVFRFNKAAASYLDLHGVAPPAYAGGTLNLTFPWSTYAGAATTGAVRWEAALQRLPAGSTPAATAKSYAYQGVSATVPDTAGGKLATASINFSQAQADGLQAGDPFILRLRRNVADAGDNAAATDAALWHASLALDGL